jgi:hypothetical protein
MVKLFGLELEESKDVNPKKVSRGRKGLRYYFN